MFTKGKWKADGAFIRDENGFGIGMCGAKTRSEEERSDNVKLIAAAPELLEACEEIFTWHDLVKQDYPEMLRPFIQVGKAIAKAKGA